MAGHPTETIVGNAPAVEALRAQIRRLATFDTPRNPHVPTVLLEGETGTGKGLVARVIHASGARARGPFIDVNCAAIPETMLEAELFGFEAGAFTDARRAKPGLFEAAAGGTLFLDEVDSLPLVLQSKLLKAIEEKSIRRLGAVAPQRVDVKLVAATPRDLRALVAAGGFRADLYHRLALVVLAIPPLRTRREDIVPLATHFLQEHAAAHGLEPRRLGGDAQAWLLAHPWPGNVRELSHLMERVTLLSPDPDVRRHTLEGLLVPLHGDVPAAPRAAAAAAPEADEATRVREALARSGGNVVRAAKLLGIGRNALRHRMRRHGIERPDLEALAAAPRAARAASRAPAAPEEPSWERKPVAVLAIDVVLPETAVEPWTLARRWAERIEDHVAGFGGVVLARSPSRLTAAFGIPRALEQLPQRAVQAALAIRRLLGDAGEPRPDIRMAVHLGAVQVDTRAADPTARLLAVGDAVALPERLLGHAAAGEILVSAPIARRVEATCDLRSRPLRMGEIDVLEAWAVGDQRTRALGETRFVGRERELGQLRESFESARTGNGQVVFVVGEAGLGKSRLLGELRLRLDDTPHLWLEGRCASYGTTTAFLPIVDALRRFLAIDDHDDEADARGKVDRAVAALGDDLVWTLPFVRHVLALDPGDAALAALDSASRRSETFRALKAITLRLAERQPLVLVVEDLHWIDPASEEFLAFIADVVPTTRALLVCSHRPGYRHPFGDRSYHVRVTLRALSAAEIADLTGSLLGDAAVPAEVRALIAGKAEGNPFFVEEMTRSLLEDGTLRRENGHVVLTRALADVWVPGTIQDVLVARLDRLADEARRAIQVASVIGREFALRLLERISEAGGHIHTHVEELRALELIYEKAQHPELAYMFKHALTHDVAYESVLHDRRRTLHRTIGLAIEELYADRLAEFYETLAHHFGRAEEWERALEYHERAAAKAAENFANRAVIAHGRQALAIAERLGDRVPDERRRGLEEQVGLASFYVSEFRAGGEAFERAAERSAQPAARGVNLFFAGLSHFWAHGYETSRRAIDAAADLASRHGLVVTGALAMNMRGFDLGVCEGDVDAEERMVGEALRICDAAGDEGAAALIRFNLAQLAEWTGDYRRSIALSEQAIAAGRKLRLAHLVVWPGWFLGKAACCLGDYRRAIRQLTEAADVCDRLGDRAWKSRLLNTLGWCMAEIGNHRRARDFNERAAAIARELGDPEIVGNSETNLALNHLALGEMDRALGYLEPMRAGLAAGGDPWMRWRYSLHILDACGRVAMAERSYEQTVAFADRQIEDAHRHRAPKVEARAQILRADALLAMDRRDDARAAAETAIQLAERIGYARAVRESLSILAEAARRAGAKANADQHAARHQTLREEFDRSLPEELRRDAT
jgi:DNA-binding NtrC family response regulator/tetratricopeptide (TPR) repeat protein